MRYLIFILLLSCNQYSRPVATIPNSKPAPVVIVTPIPVIKDTLVWADRRPIGMVMMANYVTWTGTDNYMNGDMPLTEWLLIHANNCIENMRSIGAQGLIVWDPEGAKFPRPYTYYGDPSLTPSELDIFFKTITDAGFSVGVCIRPDEIRWEFDPNMNIVSPKHYTVESPYENMKEKVKYAYKRWGCTLFYVDSNKDMPPGIDNTLGHGQPMPASIFKELHKKFPDFLFIPEHHTPEYYAYSSPYWMHQWGQSPEGATSVINCGDAVEFERGNNILMFRAWYQSPEINLIKSAYERQRISITD